MTTDRGTVLSPALNVVREARTGFLSIGWISFFVNLSVLVSPLYMQQVFDRVLQTRNLHTLLYLTLITLFLLAIFAVLDGARSRLLTHLGTWWDEAIRDEVIASAIRAARTKGQAQASVTTDLATVRGFVGGTGILPFFDAPWMPLFIALIAMMHPVLGALALVTALVLIGLAFWTEAKTRHSGKDIAERQARLASMTATALRHTDSIHAMGMLPALLTRFRAENAAVLAASQWANSFAARIGGVSKLVRLMAQILILALGAYYVTAGELTGGGMIAASIILGRALSPAEQALGAWKGFMTARQSHDRLMALLAAAPAEAHKTELPEAQGRVSLENVTFLVPGQERPILKSVSMSIEPGTVVAIMGSSGSGKSTLCKMLIGALAPTQGQVRLDGAAIGRWNEAQLGRTVGYLPQSVDLFSGTVGENIARLNRTDDKLIIAAAERASCHDIIVRLPKAYETDVGDGGAMLSGGQRQRIGLARALYGAPKLVVLDEPNSNLDNEGEAALHQAIRDLKAAGTTIILVSHRLAALAVVDKVAILKEGVLERFEDRNAVLKDLMKPVASAAQASPQSQPDADGKRPSNGSKEQANVPPGVTKAIAAGLKTRQSGEHTRGA